MSNTDASKSSASAARVSWTLARSLLRHAPTDTGFVLALTFVLILTSSVSLIMLVPLLAVAGLDVGGGAIGQIADLVAAALRVVGLSPTVPVVLVAYVAVVVATSGASYLHSVRATQLQQRYARSQRLRVFDAITRCQWRAYVRQRSSGFQHLLTQELGRVAGAVSMLLTLVVKIVTAAVYVALALIVSPAATLLVTVLGGALMGLLAHRTRLGRARGEALSQAYAGLFEAINEHLSGLRVTKAHGAEPVQAERFSRQTQRTEDATVDMVRNQADLGFWLQAGSAAIMALAFGAALLVFELPLASILLLLYLFARLVPMLTGVQRQVQQMLNLLPAVERVDAMLEWLDRYAEPAATGGTAPSLTRALRLEAVGFGYGDAGGAEVLRDVELEVPAGRTTAIVGPSGGGKSTVADLVTGLLTPDRGSVLVDDVPLEGAVLGAWRRSIGYVNQDTFLFNDSIRANLTLVRPEASDDDLLDALRSASAGFVESLPEGLDTVVGDRGVRLSGGERQRVALARAILRRPALLVLDEATSALDPENERVVQSAIGRLAGRQTLLVIAHRLASVRGADRIYVLEAGRVVESGSWDELTRRPAGRLMALVRAQGMLEDLAAGEPAGSGARPDG